MSCSFFFILSVKTTFTLHVENFYLSQEGFCFSCICDSLTLLKDSSQKTFPTLSLWVIRKYSSGKKSGTDDVRAT